MAVKNVSSGLPADLKECYRLLLKYPHIWFPIVIAIGTIGFYIGQTYAKIEDKKDINNEILEFKKEMDSIRKDERDRCDQLMSDYKEMIQKITPSNIGKNEKK